MALRERHEFSTSEEVVNRYIDCRSSYKCSLTLPDKQFCGLTDTGAVEGHHCQRVIHSTFQWADLQCGLRGVVGCMAVAVWDYCHVTLCSSWGIQAEGQYVRLAVQVSLHVGPTRDWNEREDLRKWFPKTLHRHEQENCILLPDSI